MKIFSLNMWFQDNVNRFEEKLSNDLEDRFLLRVT